MRGETVRAQRKKDGSPNKVTLTRLGVDIPPKLLMALKLHCVANSVSMRDAVANWIAEKLGEPSPFPPEE